MNNPRLLILSVLSTSVLGLMAQTTVHGQADATAGIGTATPYGAGLKLEVANAQIKVRSYIGLTGVTRYSSAETDNTWYNYSRTGNFYQSLIQRESEGYKLSYNTSFESAITPWDTFSGALSGTSSKLKHFGTRRESLLPSLAEQTDFTSPIIVNSRLDSPQGDLNTFNASTAWQHRTQLPGESITLSYDFSFANGMSRQHQSVIEREGFSRFVDNQISADTHRHQHTVLLDWKRPLTPGQMLNLGTRYDQWIIESNDKQFLNQTMTLDETFTHKTKVAAAYLGYNLVTRPFILNARVEYDYTRQQQRNLHDVIPMVRAQWKMTQQQSLIALYTMRLVRPELEFLNPAHIVGAFTVDYGNPNLEGIHINIMSLAYNLKQEEVDFTATVQHIRAEDGFNAIWMEKDNIRESFYGNEGVRRAWSFTPEVEWKASPFTTLSLKGIVLWDKRIARAISMAKEHWGFTTQAKVKQLLPAGFRLDAHYDYSEGNTVDLYSHEGRSMAFGASLQRSFLPADNLTISLAYDYHEYARIILTQGAYTGRVFAHPDNRNAASINLTYKF